MTPQAALFLAKAKKLLLDGNMMISVALNDAAGRNAYLAAFHAAQALIAERTGKIIKTHNGVQTEFLKLTKDDPQIDADSRLFLSRAYNLKAVADYETGPDRRYQRSVLPKRWHPRTALSRISTRSSLKMAYRISAP